jgi:hypothetical protein
MPYYNKLDGSQVHPLIGDTSPAHIVELPSEHIAWDKMPAGMQFTYDGNNIPSGYELAPGPIYTAEEQVKLDLHNAGVNVKSLLSAKYLNDRGDPAPLAAIDAAIDLVVISSGLTLAQVSELV